MLDYGGVYGVRYEHGARLLQSLEYWYLTRLIKELQVTNEQ